MSALVPYLLGLLGILVFYALLFVFYCLGREDERKEQEQQRASIRRL